MNKLVTLGLNAIRLSFMAIAVLAGVLVGPSYPAQLIPADLQYPVIEMKPAFRRQILELAGARNEYLLLHCRFPGADPASFKIKVTPFKIKVVKARRLSITPQLGLAFYQLCWAPPGSKGKLPPDALLPLDQGLISTGDALEIVTTLHIPPDFPKGSFQFELVASDRKQTFRLHLQLRVYDFALPDDVPITIFGHFWPYLHEHYAKYGIDSVHAYLQAIKAYYQSLRQYKVNALGGVHFFPFEEVHPDAKIEEFQDYHQLVDYALNQAKFRRFMIPKLPGWRTINQPGDTFISQANVFYPLYQDYLKRHGWADRALNYLIDEPKPEDYPAVQQAFATAKNLAPTIKTLCAGWNPAPEFVKVIDTWATPAAYYKESQANTARSQGQKQWLYANRLHGIDHPLVHQRLIGWLLYRYQFSGYLLWGVNFWPNDPWSTEPGAADYMRRGTFYYPHPQTGLPVPTLRLESFRRGLQDYQYLQLLAEARRKGLVSKARFAYIERRLQVVTRDFQTNEFQVPMQQLESLRLQIGELLDRLGHRLGYDTQKVPPPLAIDKSLPESNLLREIWRYIRNRK